MCNMPDMWVCEVRVRDWNKILVSDKCGNYYDKNPCRAHTCNLKHAFCEGHRNLLEKSKNDKK